MKELQQLKRFTPSLRLFRLGIRLAIVSLASCEPVNHSEFNRSTDFVNAVTSGLPATVEEFIIELDLRVAEPDVVTSQAISKKANASWAGLEKALLPQCGKRKVRILKSMSELGEGVWERAELLDARVEEVLRERFMFACQGGDILFT